MNSFKVPITTIKEIKKHPNADTLSIYKCFDFEVIAKTGLYSLGQLVIYCPIDSILPSDLEVKLFPSDSKIKLHKSRVRQIKIRSYPSQGMIIDTNFLTEKLGGRWQDFFTIDQDVSELLGVTKYEPPAAKYQQVQGPGKKRKENPLFKKYNGVENIKWYPDIFSTGEEVVIQCKLHGSLCRASMLPFKADTLWKKLKKFFGFAPEHEFYYGSNNVEISSKVYYKGYYGEDVYGKVLKKVDAFKKLKPNEIIYGELIGKSIQSGYDYGHKDGHHFVLFGVRKVLEDGSLKWLNPEEAEDYAKERGFDFVPVLYKGPYNKELAYSLTKGPSVYCLDQKVREGIVIKSRYNYNDDYFPSNKKEVKWINEDYLADKNNTDFH